MSVVAKARVVAGAIRDIGLPSTCQFYLRWLLYSLGRPLKQAFRLRPRGMRYPVILRGGASSDSSVFRQIFIEQEYQPLYDMLDPKSVLDLGANTGLASVAFLTRFPNAQVVAVEPDTENHRLCLQNMQAYGSRARAILGAVWSRSGKVDLTRTGDCREWSVTVVEPADDAQGLVQCWDVPTLFTMAGFEMVDLLKVDIEGGEIAIFNGNSIAWIKRVRNLCIELHGRECEEAFFSAMSGFEYQLEHSGELVICRNIRLRQGD
jgi:FkbM family methyltransferase